MPVIPGSIR